MDDLFSRTTMNEYEMMVNESDELIIKLSSLKNNHKINKINVV